MLKFVLKISFFLIQYNLLLLLGNSPGKRSSASQIITKMHNRQTWHFRYPRGTNHTHPPIQFRKMAIFGKGRNPNTPSNNLCVLDLARNFGRSPPNRHRNKGQALPPRTQCTEIHCIIDTIKFYTIIHF